MRQHEQHAENVFDDRICAIATDIADSNAPPARTLQVDVVGARCGQANEAQFRCQLQVGIMQAYLVGDDKLGRGNSLVQVLIARCIEEFEVREQVG